MGCVAGALLAGLLVWISVRNRLVLPLRGLRQAISRAAESDWQRIPEQGRGEAAAAIDAFNRMVDSLARSQRELQRAIIEAEAVGRAKDAFLAHMSHELRTPLNAIIGFSHVMRDEMFGPLGSERYRGYAVDIHESGGHLLGVINDILDLSKVAAGKFALTEEPFDLAEAVQACVRLIQAQAKQHEIEIVTELDSDLQRLRGDEVRVKQIIVNLLSNAVKFTPRHGRVTISARRAHHGGVTFTVSDNGIGMAPEDIPHALAPFRQIEGERWKTREGSGTGLGLPLAKAFAELHGAQFSVDSARGLGTAVTVSFPADRLLRGDARAATSGR